MKSAVTAVVFVFVIFAAQSAAHAQTTGQEGMVAARGAAPAPSGTPSPDYGSSNLPAQSQQYRIGMDDVLTISVWHQPDLSRTVPVRPDGRISLPLIGEVMAEGKTTPELEDELKASFSQFVKAPELTVIVSQIRSRRINIIGQVTHPGAFTLTQSMGVLDALAAAGGLRDFAKKNKIYVLRETSSGHRVRLPYDYKAVLQGKKDAQDILLQADDTVVVP